MGMKALLRPSSVRISRPWCAGSHNHNLAWHVDSCFPLLSNTLAQRVRYWLAASCDSVRKKDLGEDLPARAHCTIHSSGRQDARIHVSEPEFEVLTQGGLLVDSSIDGGITVVEFERIIRAQLTLHVQASFSRSPPSRALPSFPAALSPLIKCD